MDREYDPIEIMAMWRRRFLDAYDPEAIELFRPWLLLKQYANDVEYERYYARIAKLAAEFTDHVG